MNGTNRKETEEKKGLSIKNGVLESCDLRQAEIVVPEGVHTIGAGAFKGCIFLERVILPETVMILSADAFKGCRRLRNIDLPSGLKEIGDYAFHRCHNLKEIKLPASVTKLGNCVFLYCDSLETIWMPGVTSLGLQVFLNDVNLKSILISKELDTHSICDCFTGCACLKDFYFSDGTSCHIRNAVAALEPETRRVSLPSTLKRIGSEAFAFCYKLTGLNLPEGLELIEDRAFAWCPEYESFEENVCYTEN